MRQVSAIVGSYSNTSNANMFSSLIFSSACFCMALISADLLGPGMWGYLFIGGGLFVGVSAFVPALDVAARTTAVLAALLAVAAVLLGLLAATIGGSFQLRGSEAWLLASFAVIAIAGFVRGRTRIAPQPS